MNAPEAIVVGYDGSNNSRRAVEYAAVMAQERSLSLHVVHCYAWSATESGRAEVARRMLADLSQDVASKYPDLPVRTSLVSRSPATTLIAESRQAAMVVVGHEGAGTFRGVHTGAVCRQVASQSHCPVTVLRGGTERHDRPVLLALDADAVASDPEAVETEALEYAFSQVTRKGVELKMFHLHSDEDSGLAQPTAPLVEAVAPWRDRYPSIEVSTTPVPRGRAAESLVSASRDAGLLVAGSRATGTNRPVPVGALHGPLVTSADCPVVIMNRPADGALISPQLPPQLPDQSG